MTKPDREIEMKATNKSRRRFAKSKRTSRSGQSGKE